LPPDTPVILLHSRFYQTDRQAKEDNLRHDFGKDKKGKAILIATQVVEVGLDITCEALHTELAPANAILQRAGRCARYKGEVGQVYIYRLPENEEGKVQYAPYRQKGQPEICNKTWIAFQACQGQSLTFGEEQNLISQVHDEADEILLGKLKDNQDRHTDMMARAITEQARESAKDLIRDVYSCNILIHPDPCKDVDEKDNNRLRSPFRWESFSVPFYRVHEIWKQCKDLATQHGFKEWVMMWLDTPTEETVERYGKQYKRTEERSRLVYQWEDVGDKEGLLDRTLLIALNPHFATYSEARGLELGVFNEQWEDFPTHLRPFKSKGDDVRYTYQLETYQEHIAGLYHAYGNVITNENKWSCQPLQAEMAYVFARLEQQFNWPGGTLDKIARYIIAGHDLGKLGQGWQEWVHLYQEKIGEEVTNDMMLAHTHNDGGDAHKKVAKQLKHKPPHAAESAYCLLDVTLIVIESMGIMDEEIKTSLNAAINMAITCHHSATHQGEVKPFKLHAHGKKALKEAFDLVGLQETPLNKILAEIKHIDWLKPEDKVDPTKLEGQALLYFLLVRLLRLADQRSQQK